MATVASTVVSAVGLGNLQMRRKVTRSSADAATGGEIDLRVHNCEKLNELTQD